MTIDHRTIRDDPKIDEAVKRAAAEAPPLNDDQIALLRAAGHPAAKRRPSPTTEAAS